MRKLLIILIGFSLTLTVLSLPAVIGAENDRQQQEEEPAVDMKAIERGRYMVKIAGCNDCHTEGYLTAEGNVPEEQWLGGSSLGWSGPWGTTYATNLKRFMKGLTEDQWVDFAHAVKARPPMPWWALHEIDTPDLRAIYQFIRHIRQMGENAPDYLNPGQKPHPPYAEFFFGPDANASGTK